jgi:hypothetical protein
MIRTPPICKIHGHLGDALFTLFFGLCFSVALDPYQSKGFIVVLILYGLVFWGIGGGCFCARMTPAGFMNTRSGRIPFQCFFQAALFGGLVFLFSLTVFWRNEFFPRDPSEESNTYIRVSFLILRWLVILSTGVTSSFVFYQLTPERVIEEDLEIGATAPISREIEIGATAPISREMEVAPISR